MSVTTKNNWAFVDDQSPRIDYQGVWFNEIGVDKAWNQTLSFANSSQSSAMFRFNGNRVAVLGFVNFEGQPNAPISEYMVDNGSPSTFQPTKQQNGSTVTFFLSPLLADGDHTLIFKPVSNGISFFVDAIAYNMSSQPSSTSGTSQPTVVTTVIETPSSTTSTSGHTSSSSDLVGPIVGGVVGGIALIVCACLAFYFLYWKRSRQRALYQYHATDTRDDWDSDTKPLFRGPYGPIPRQSQYGPAPPQSALPYANAATAYPPPPPSAGSVSVYSTTEPPQFPSPEPSPRAPPSRHTSYAPTESLADSASSYTSSAPSASSASSQRTVLTLVGAGTAPLRIAPKGGAGAGESKKALEAGAGDGAARPVTQHADSGLRFDLDDGGDGGGAGPSGTAHDAKVPEELPPVYSES